MKNISIKVKVITLNTISIFIVSLIIIMLFLKGTLSLHEDNLKDYEIDLMKSRKSEIKSQVDTASKAMESFYNDSKPENIANSIKKINLEFKKELTQFYNYHKEIYTEEKLKKEIIKFVKFRRYNLGIGYFWINDFDYKIIMHPIKPSLDGKIFSKESKLPFFALGADSLKKSGDTDVIIEYEFMNPKSKKQEEKVSSLFVFKPFNWIIGTGAYKSNLENQLKKEALKVISNLSYGKGGYFWINDIDGKMVYHPKKALVGKNLINEKNFSFIQMTIDVANTKEEDFINYTFPKKGSAKFEPKISYVKYFKKWKWIIGTGVYIDDIDKKLAVMEQESSQKIDSLLLTNILAALFVMLVFIIITLITVKRSISEPINKFKDKVLDISDNYDLRDRVDTNAPLEIMQMGKSFNILMDSLQELISTSKNASIENSSISNELSATSHSVGVNVEDSVQITQDTTEQAKEIQEGTIIAIADAQQSKKNIMLANENLITASEDIIILSSKVQRTAETESELSQYMHSLSEDANEVKTILTVISDIAEQTNLLALNAAIEAARAGEHGRGFAVVADEVRKLAERTQKSLSEINATINVVVQSIMDASSKINDNSDESQKLAISAQEVQDKINTTVNMVNEAVIINDKTLIKFEENGNSVELIVSKIQEINSLSTTNARSVEEIASAAEHLSKLTDNLNEKLEKFHT